MRASFHFLEKPTTRILPKALMSWLIQSVKTSFDIPDAKLYTKMCAHSNLAMFGLTTSSLDEAAGYTVQSSPWRMQHGWLSSASSQNRRGQSVEVSAANDAKRR